MVYTINYKECYQNSANFIDTADENYVFPSFLNYDEVLKHSIREGFIRDEKDIISFCSGCDDYSAYFSAISAEENCEAELSPYGVEFDNEETEYNVF